MFSDFGINRALPAFAETVVELTPDRAGEFGFACGMNMVHGTLVVVDDGHMDLRVLPGTSTAAAVPEPVDRGPSRVADDDAEAAARRAEIADLTRRVVLGAVLAAPVALAVMAHEVFDATWVPALLLNRWVQLALIAPVMLYTGWPAAARLRVGSRRLDHRRRPAAGRLRHRLHLGRVAGPYRGA